MNISKLSIKHLRLLFCFLQFAFCISFSQAQSNNIDYPTPVTSNEISGKIRARDIGDSRLTSFYYVFNGNQGDVFVNVETENFNGDIDIFAAAGLRPLSNIKMFADADNSETGRIVYLRQPEKLILKIEGRTPDDNPATFRIKFAGSFAVYQGVGKNSEPELPDVKTSNDNSVRVNSVGTIIEEKPETKVVEKTKVAENNPAEKTDEEKTNEENIKEKNPSKAKVSDDPTPQKQVASDNESSKSAVELNRSRVPGRRKTPVKNTVKPAKAEPTEAVKTAPPANPLENVRLIVLMKNGDKVEYPMTNVFRFSLNNNILTIILNDGKIERRSILDIQKFSVE